MKRLNRIAKNEQQAGSSRLLKVNARIMYERLMSVLVFGKAPNEEKEARKVEERRLDFEKETMREREKE